MKDYFRRIYVGEPSHNVAALKRYTDELRFLATGYEDVSDLAEVIARNTLDFDPEQDAVVPVGRVITSFVAGAVLASKFIGQPIYIGIYKEKDYDFAPIQPAQVSP